MLFNTLQFATFFAVVLVAYWALRFRGQNVLLLVASYAFYAGWDWRFLGLLIFQTLVDYFAGLMIGRSDDDRVRTRALVAAVTINLAILAVFKYSGFFIDSAVNLLESIGFNADPPVLRILLPVGISFYTFQSITYSFDVYRRRLEPTANLVDYAVFVAYFPHMVAGPIQRADHLLPQIQHPRVRPGVDRIRSGAFLILLGLFKKVAIADAVAGIADEAFGRASTAGAGMLAIGLLAFALQIYGDFAGYSDMARGVSRLLGIELTRNFEQPYLARNITEFWRTWHISLSSWLHDYLYVPLGGNQKGKWTTYRNLMITMLLGGLWHGASWTFVAWGGIHGALLSLHKMLGGRAPRGRVAAFRARDLPKVAGTFAVVCFAWVFFRAASFTEALDYLGGLFSLRGGSVDRDHVMLVVASAVLMLLGDLAQRLTNDHEPVLRWRPILRGATYATLVLMVLIWSGGEAQPFIYFQF